MKGCADWFGDGRVNEWEWGSVFVESFVVYESNKGSVWDMISGSL